MRKFMSMALAVGMLASCVGMASCGGKDESDSLGDVSGKTMITVASYNGGLGLAWLRDAAGRFSARYANQSFEEGKTGVAVDVVESMAGDMLQSRSLNEDVYLTESVDYYLMQSQGKFADITDVVTADLGDGSGKTIEQKMDSAMGSYLKAKDQKYYAIPFYDGFYGFIYDVDLFETKGWFFDEAGNFTKTSKSKGLDGKEGTYDDGMPKTYAQFGQLVDKIRMDSDGITPFMYGGSDNEDYFIEALANYWANYEGKANMQLNWSLNGTANLITGFNNGEPVIEAKTITDANKVDLQKQAGKYYALKFMRDIVTGNGQNYATATDFKAAQFALIQSCLDGEVQPGATAMIIDGSWFENEAELSGTFETVSMMDMSAGIAGKDYKTTRKFAFMPIPMVDDTCSTKQTLISSNESYCFINAATSGGKLDVAKAFVKFLHTDAELSAFNKVTSITRPYTYAMSESDRNSMSYYGQSLLQMKETSDIVYPYSDNLTYIANSTQHRLENWAWQSKYGGTPVFNPFTQFKANPNLTAQSYFEGLIEAY